MSQIVYQPTCSNDDECDCTRCSTARIERYYDEHPYPTIEYPDWGDAYIVVVGTRPQYPIVGPFIYTDDDDAVERIRAYRAAGRTRIEPTETQILHYRFVFEQEARRADPQAFIFWGY